MKYVWLVAASLCVLASCGGDNPAGPGPTGSPQAPQPEACRTYVSARTITSAFHDGARFTTSGTCTYDRLTGELACTDVYSAGSGRCSGTTIRMVTQYSSLSEFVAEASVVPPLTRWISTRSTSSNPACQMMPDGSPTGTSTNSYTHGRLAETWSTARLLPPLPELAPYTRLAYTAWDSLGRPTVSSYPSILLSYDEQARTATTTIPIAPRERGQLATPFIIVRSYDGDGNLTGTVMTYPPVGEFMRLAVSISATARICR